MNFVPSEHQAAGHAGSMTSGVVFAKLTTQQEIDFYTNTVASDVALGDHISHWMPTFMGTLQEGEIGEGGGGGKGEGKGEGNGNGEREGEGKGEGNGNGEGERGHQPDSSSLTPHNSSLLNLNLNSPQKQYLVLSNLYYGLIHPCILDIKLGAVLVDDTVSEEKRLRLSNVSSSTTSGSLGFRICGMKIYATDSRVPPLFPGIESTVSTSDGYVSFDKNFGKSLTSQNVAAAIEHFFSPLVSLQRPVITRFLQRLQLLYNCLLDTEVRIKSGSLCFVYDAEMAAAGWDEQAYYDADALVQEYADDTSDCDSNKPGGGLSSLHLIDFAHAKYTPGQGPDENILEGVENLIDIFTKLSEK